MGEKGGGRYINTILRKFRGTSPAQHCQQRKRWVNDVHPHPDTQPHALQCASSKAYVTLPHSQANVSGMPARNAS